MLFKIHYTSVKGRRDSNEDHHTLIMNIDNKDENLNPINFFGIYDGHGGDAVSDHIHKVLPLHYMNKENKFPFTRDFHVKKCKELQDEILKSEYGYNQGSACIYTILYKHDNEIHLNTINLGDSRLCIVYDTYKVKQITTDHKPDETNEEKRILALNGDIYTDTEGVIRIGDLSVSKSFGDGDNAPYISQVPDCFYNKITNNTKYVVLACDGLWDEIESKDLGNVIKDINSKNIKNVNLASELANYALKKGSTDNISVIVIEISNI